MKNKKGESLGRVGGESERGKGGTIGASKTLWLGGPSGWSSLETRSNTDGSSYVIIIPWDPSPAKLKVWD